MTKPRSEIQRKRIAVKSFRVQAISTYPQWLHERRSGYVLATPGIEFTSVCNNNIEVGRVEYLARLALVAASIRTVVDNEVTIKGKEVGTRALGNTLLHFFIDHAPSAPL